MDQQFNDVIRSIAKGDTRLAEGFFRRKGGRKYLENLTLILLNTLAPHAADKEEMYLGFLEVLDCMELRLQHQKEGEEILEHVFKEV